MISIVFGDSGTTVDIGAEGLILTDAAALQASEKGVFVKIALCT